MPRKKARHKRPPVEYSDLSVYVEGYEAGVGANVNHEAYAPQYAW